MATTKHTPNDALQAGQQAAEGLAAALKAAGFTLPSLMGGFPVNNHGRVELGGASADLITELAKWINELRTTEVLTDSKLNPYISAAWPPCTCARCGARGTSP